MHGKETVKNFHLLGARMKPLNFMKLVLVVECHQVDVALFGKLNVTRWLCCVGVNYSGWCDVQGENLRYFARRSAVKRASNGCQSF